MSFSLRPYQIEIATKWTDILQKYGIFYCTAEVRTGKTLIALETVRLYGAKNCLFVTKKKAISSIESDYKNFGYTYQLTVTNYENIHNIDTSVFDIAILDEAHGTISGFPKPSLSQKQIKKALSKLPIIFLSGTPIIESACKIFPTLGVSDRSPFKAYKNFYAWFKDYGIPKTIYTSYGQAIDYSNSKTDKILREIDHLLISWTQEQSWFSTKITEHIIRVRLEDSTYSLIRKLVKDRVIVGKNHTILADTGVKLQIVLHQLFSWTIKFEDGTSQIIDRSKANLLKERFWIKKIAILYCFKQELELLKEVYRGHLTTDLEEFNTTDKSYAWQFVATREGVNLSKAEALVFFNLPFSWTSYVQWRDRMSSKDREENHVYFMCSDHWIEEKILEIVREKGDYSNKIFKRDFLT